MIENLIVIICILIFVGSIYLLNRYKSVNDFKYYYKALILNTIKKEITKNNNTDVNEIIKVDQFLVLRLVHMYSKHNFLELWFSFKPLVLRSYFSRDEIKLLGRKVKQETESIEEIISEYNKIGCVI